MLQRVLDKWLESLPLRRRVLEFLAARGVTAYLVGGTVRDALLGRASYDLDLAVDAKVIDRQSDGPAIDRPSGGPILNAQVHGSAMALARQMADYLRGAYVPLDEARDVGRVVLQAGRQHVDVAALRGADIEADLGGRDYTINAMAVPIVRPWDGLIDPTGGQSDLAAHVLRVVSETAFHDDPLRILRGIRLRASLGFELEGKTESLMREWLPGLARVSGERVRDELLLLLSCDVSAPALEHGQDLGAFQVVLPASITADALAAGVRGVETLEGHLQRLRNAGLAVAEDDLGRVLRAHAADLHAHWSEELALGRQRWLLLKLATWLGFAACGPGALRPVAFAREIMRRLRLSAREERYVAATLDGAFALAEWADDVQVGPLEAYRFYRRTGDAGVDGAVLAMVQAEISGDATRASARASDLLRAWFEQSSSWVDPPALLSGHDLVITLGMAPGPELGEWLERMREAQVQGLVNTREQALVYIQAHRT
jgi:poly(A) polymerase